jgi:tRNA pseudouridine38-40 synthase|tara:strand:- start:1131 stop:1946 length:816 start_codon:yes stop_codon:yes gene_type:complete
MSANIDEPLNRVALGIEYNGNAYHGWQIQLSPDVLTIQGCLEKALSFVANQPVRVNCAGRTDARVHGTAQVAHIETTVSRPMKAWVQGVNAKLPDDIVVTWAVPVSNDFHARFSATARHYQYFIANTAVRPAIHAGAVTWVREPLNELAMNEAAQCLVGLHDFSSFRASSCQSHTGIRTMHSITVSRRKDLIIIDVCANAFLHHMVRNIAGALLVIGKGQQSTAWFSQIFQAKDRTKAPPTAAPHGLYLVDVSYPESFGLPQQFKSPIWLI